MPDVTPKQATIICPHCNCGSGADKYILESSNEYFTDQIVTEVDLKCPRCGEVFEIKFKEDE